MVSIDLSLSSLGIDAVERRRRRKGIWCPVIDFIRSRLWIAVHVYIDVLHWLLLAVGLGLSCGINKKAAKTDVSDRGRLLDIYLYQ